MMKKHLAAGIGVAVVWTAMVFAGGAPQSFDGDKLRGIVTPARQVVLKAPVDGLLNTVNVRENEVVQAGQPIFTMDRRMQQAAVEIARLEVRKAELALEEAQIQYERMQQLGKTNAAHDWEVRKYRVERDLANVALEHARQTLELETARLERHQMASPFSAVAIRQMVHGGASLKQGDEVMTVVEIDPLEARVFLPVELYGTLRIGQTYRFDAGAPVNRVIEAKMKTFEPVIDSASQTFRCIFTIDNHDRSLPAGFPVRFLTSESPR